MTAKLSTQFFFNKRSALDARLEFRVTFWT